MVCYPAAGVRHERLEIRTGRQVQVHCMQAHITDAQAGEALSILRGAVEETEGGDTMKRKTAAIFWPIVAMLAVFALGFMAALSRRPEPARVEVIARSGPSAAATLSLVLFGVLAVFILALVGAVILALVIRARQHTRQMEKAALLFGARQPQPTQQRRSRVGPGDGPSIVIVSGGQGGGPRVEDMRDGR